MTKKPKTPKTTRAPKHGCVDRMNEAMAKAGLNTQLTAVLSLRSASTVPIALGTEKIDERVRRGPSLLFASFCPFCGVSLVKEGGS